jgi:hypothetical protein
MEVCGKLHVPAALPTGKEPRCSLNRRIYGPQIQAGCFGKEKNLLPLLRFELQIISSYHSHYTDYTIPAQSGFRNKNKQARNKANVGDLCGLAGFCHNC